MNRIISIVLLIIAVGGLIFSKWVGPWLQTAIGWITQTPFGAIIVMMSLLVFIANIINWLVNLGRIRY